MKKKILELILTIFLIFNMFNICLFASSYNNSLNSFENYSVASSSIAILSEEEVTASILSDLINELRPFMKDIIKENLEINHKFSTKEALTIITRHPVKFLTALYNYVRFSLENIFNIASQNVIVVTE